MREASTSAIKTVRFLNRAADFKSQCQSAFAAVFPAGCRYGRYAGFRAQFLQQGYFRGAVRCKTVDCRHSRHAEFGKVFQMNFQIGKSSAERFGIFFAEFVLVNAAVHFQSPYRGDENDGSRFQPACAAFDVKEFFRAQIGAEPGFGYDIIGQPQRCFGRNQTVAAVGDVGKGAAVYQRRRFGSGRNHF